MKIDPEKDHGTVVWARLSRNSPFWAGIVISTKILNLMYEEKPEKTWIYWLACNSVSNVQNDRIHEFKVDFEKRSNNLTGAKKKGVLEAIEILCIQLTVNIPDEVLRTNHLIKWAKENIIEKTQNMIGKSTRNKALYIPDEILTDIKKMNCQNIDRANQMDKHLDVPKNKKKTNENLKKKKCVSCLGCKNPIVGKKKEHPFFKGYVCEPCYTGIKRYIMTISSDNYNNVCCICCVYGEYNTVLCESCVRIYCENCISYFCGSSGFEQIKNVEMWNCYACNDTKVVPSGLERRSTDEQLHNIFMMFPINKSDRIVCGSTEINVLALKDDQNFVPTILNTVEFPFQLSAHFENYNEPRNGETNLNQPNLLIQYISSYESNITENLKYIKTCEDFMNFIFIKNKIELSYLNSGRKLFWAFETSAAITYSVRDTISRFTEKEPFLVTNSVKDVKNRGRMIWTNIFVREEDICDIKCWNIFDHKIVLAEGTSLCYDSVYMLLTCFIQHHMI